MKWIRSAVFSRAQEGWRNFQHFFNSYALTDQYYHFLSSIPTNYVNIHNCLKPSLWWTIDGDGYALIIGFPRGSTPGTLLDKSWQHVGNSALFKKKISLKISLMAWDINALFVFLNEFARSLGCTLDMFDVGQWYVTFKIPDKGAGDRPFCQLYGILWRSSLFVTCLFSIMLFFKGVWKTRIANSK